MTDNAANNLKAFENLIVPDFEHYLDHENINDDETESDAMCLVTRMIMKTHLP